MRLLHKILYPTLARVLASAKRDKLKDGREVELTVQPANRQGGPAPKDLDSTEFAIDAHEVGRKDPIGFAKFFHEGGKTYVYETLVDQSYRRLGVATLLYNYAQELLDRSVWPGEMTDPSGNTTTSDDAKEFWRKRNPELASQLWPKSTSND